MAAILQEFRSRYPRNENLQLKSLTEHAQLFLERQAASCTSTGCGTIEFFGGRNFRLDAAWLGTEWKGYDPDMVI
jgi:hypothetical protein